MTLETAIAHLISDDAWHAPRLHSAPVSGDPIRALGDIGEDHDAFAALLESAHDYPSWDYADDLLI